MLFKSRCRLIALLCASPCYAALTWPLLPCSPFPPCPRGAKGRAQRAFRRRAEEMEEEAAALEEEGLRKRRRTREPGASEGPGRLLRWACGDAGVLVQLAKSWHTLATASRRLVHSSRRLCPPHLQSCRRTYLLRWRR